MRMSISASAMWLTTAAEAATKAMPRVPNTRTSTGTMPGVASSMPTMAQSSMSATTLGLHISK